MANDARMVFGRKGICLKESKWVDAGVDDGIGKVVDVSGTCERWSGSVGWRRRK